jgi:hypothetical protein
MTRAEQREMKWKFRDIKGVMDKRHQSYITYEYRSNFVCNDTEECMLNSLNAGNDGHVQLG